jgi:signal transduction histidine kinase
MCLGRELHDIVAHSLSVIVIQASAGGRLAPDDPTAAGLLDTITELTDQVYADLDGLTRLLDQSSDLTASLSRQSIEELVNRTSATGSRVSCQLPEGFDHLPGKLGTVAYRVIQESLTNAIKHAPGAPIEVTIATPGNVRVAVTNGAARASAAAPAAPGSGRGIAGLTERVHAINGTFMSGPTPQGGWQVNAELPL